MSENIKNFEIYLEFKNYKKLKELKLDFTGSNLYLIQGKNNLGKTSITNAIRDLMLGTNETPNPLTQGENFGQVRGRLPGPDGAYTITMDFDEKGSRFTAVDPKQNVITKVTELRSLLKYNSISVNEFLLMSNTAEGRRKQVEMVSNLLSETDQIEFRNLLQSVDGTKGVLFLNRKKSKADHEAALRTLELLPVVEAPNNLAIENIIKEKEVELQSLKSSIQESSESHTKKTIELNNLTNELNNKSRERNEAFQSYTNKKAEYEKLYKEIQDIAVKIKEMDEFTKEKLPIQNNLQREIDNVKVLTDPIHEKIEEVEQVIKENQKIIDSADAIVKQVESRKSQETLVENYKNKAIADEDALDNARIKLKTISKRIASNISVNDDGYLSIDGFLLDENQVCKSETMKAVAGILMKMNTSPIITMSDLESMDEDNLEMLRQLAEENNFIIIGDRVVNEVNEITVVGIEQND